MLFGTTRDFNLLTKINRELLSDIVEQEVLYYKMSLEDVSTNIYGEALEKSWLSPVKLNCLITRGDQVVNVDDLGPDVSRENSYAFLRKDLEITSVVPEVGDIIFWHEDYYEVDTVRENQLFAGRDEAYNIGDYGSSHGESVSIIVDCHLTRADRVGLTENI